MYIANVEREEVFNVMKEGTEVYAVNRQDDFRNLFYLPFDEVLTFIKDEKYAFFCICE